MPVSTWSACKTADLGISWTPCLAWAAVAGTGSSNMIQVALGRRGTDATRTVVVKFGETVVVNRNGGRPPGVPGGGPWTTRPLPGGPGTATATATGATRSRSTPSTTTSSSPAPKRLWRTADGGASWVEAASFYSPHEDQHAVVFDPRVPGLAWLANDGGVFRSTDGGRTWHQRNVGLVTAQFYRVGIAGNRGVGNTYHSGIIASEALNGGGWANVEGHAWEFANVWGDPRRPNYFYVLAGELCRLRVPKLTPTDFQIPWGTPSFRPAAVAVDGARRRRRSWPGRQPRPCDAHPHRRGFLAELGRRARDLGRRRRRHRPRLRQRHLRAGLCDHRRRPVVQQGRRQRRRVLDRAGPVDGDGSGGRPGRQPPGARPGLRGQRRHDPALRRRRRDLDADHLGRPRTRCPPPPSTASSPTPATAPSCSPGSTSASSSPTTRAGPGTPSTRACPMRRSWRSSGPPASSTRPPTVAVCGAAPGPREPDARDREARVRSSIDHKAPPELFGQERRNGLEVALDAIRHEEILVGSKCRMCRSHRLREGGAYGRCLRLARPLEWRRAASQGFHSFPFSGSRLGGDSGGSRYTHVRVGGGS